MIRSSRLLPLLVALTTLAALNACSPTPDPNAKRIMVACLTVSDTDASAILGAQVAPFRLTADEAPRAICSEPARHRQDERTVPNRTPALVPTSVPCNRASAD